MLNFCRVDESERKIAFSYLNNHSDMTILVSHANGEDIGGMYTKILFNKVQINGKIKGADRCEYLLL